MTRNEYCELLCQYETVSQLKARIKEGEKNLIL